MLNSWLILAALLTLLVPSVSAQVYQSDSFTAPETAYPDTTQKYPLEPQTIDVQTSKGDSAQLSQYNQSLQLNRYLQFITAQDSLIGRADIHTWPEFFDFLGMGDSDMMEASYKNVFKQIQSGTLKGKLETNVLNLLRMQRMAFGTRDSIRKAPWVKGGAVIMLDSLCTMRVPDSLRVLRPADVRKLRTKKTNNASPNEWVIAPPDMRWVAGVRLMETPHIKFESSLTTPDSILKGVVNGLKPNPLKAAGNMTEHFSFSDYAVRWVVLPQYEPDRLTYAHTDGQFLGTSAVSRLLLFGRTHLLVVRLYAKDHAALGGTWLDQDSVALCRAFQEMRGVFRTAAFREGFRYGDATGSDEERLVPMDHLITGGASEFERQIAPFVQSQIAFHAEQEAAGRGLFAYLFIVIGGFFILLISAFIKRLLRPLPKSK
jgi:hypothetical protein